MANLDTRSKRASSVGIALSFVLAPPLPDGTISLGDRQHIAISYSGIAPTQSGPPAVLYTGKLEATTPFTLHATAPFDLEVDVL